jgi:triosephosphate isomerase
MANEKALEANLKTLIFAGDLEELKNIVTLKPTYVSYEPAALIGSTTNSVARAQPEIISQAYDIAREGGEPLIVGAGVSSMEDIKKSLELGATGVAIATAVVKAPDPKAKLLELVEGFK